jgi:tRNA(Arg) A34 adenosine deaminase TadA
MIRTGMTNEKDLKFIKEAVDVALKGVSENRGGPFGCVIVKDGLIIAKGCNEVLSSNDATAHAEVVAIRKACQHLKSHQLVGCTIFTSCEPCPMCLGAIYWARPDRIVYACTRKDAGSIGFDDDFIYKEILLPPSERHIEMQQCGLEHGLEVFRFWQNKPDKIQY